MENNNKKFITAGIIVLIILMGTYAYRKYEKLKETLPYYVTNPTTHKVYQSNKPDKPIMCLCCRCQSTIFILSFSNQQYPLDCISFKFRSLPTRQTGLASLLNSKPLINIRSPLGHPL